MSKTEKLDSTHTGARTHTHTHQLRHRRNIARSALFLLSTLSQIKLHNYSNKFRIIFAFRAADNRLNQAFNLDVDCSVLFNQFIYVCIIHLSLLPWLVNNKN